MNTFDISLDVGKGVMLNAPVIIGQGDKAGATIRATIFDHGAQCTLTGMTAKFMLRSGGGYFEDAACSVSGSTVTYVVDEQHAATVSGMAQAYFALYQGSTHVYSTSRFDVKVLRAASSGADPAQSYSDDIVAATQAARAAADAAEEAMEDLGTAVSDAQQAAASASQAVSDARQAISGADTAKQTATSAANAATTAAASATTAASSANAAATATNAAISTANNAAARAEDAIDAMGDIAEQAVPLMSADVRGGAKLGEGLALTDGALGIDPAPHESTGEVRGSIAALTAEGWAEQNTTTGKNLLPNNVTSQTVNGVTFTVNADGSVTVNGTATANAVLKLCNASTFPTQPAGTYTMSGGLEGCRIAMQYADSTSPDAGQTGVLSASTSPSSITVQNGLRIASGNYSTYLLVQNGTTVNGIVRPQLELGSTATEYEPYTGGAPSPSPDYPQEIQVVRGRNLLDAATFFADLASEFKTKNLQLAPNTTYVMSATLPQNRGGAANLFVFETGASGDTNTNGVWNGQSRTVTTGADGIVVVGYRNVGYTDTSLAWYISHEIQLELGSTPTPYVPYGHVGLEVRQGSTLLSTTPIPLPSRGWVGSLPDGTADVLALDGAGKVEWELPVGHIASYAGETVGTPYLSTTGQLTTGAEVYHKLATPTTEERGYADMPAIPDAATVSIPELDALGVKYYVDGGAATLARQYYERARSEYEDRITALEQAVAELVTS